MYICMLPLNLVLEAFSVYVTPIFHYGLPMWIKKCSNSSMLALDALFTKFLKRYSHLPQWTNNATLHFVTQTEPFSTQLKNRAFHLTSGLSFPSCMSGISLSFLSMENGHVTEKFNPIPEIPSSFWLSKMFMSLPANSFYRKKICKELFDTSHRETCMTQKFHTSPVETCVCSVCGEHAHPYHHRFCTGFKHT